MGTGCRSFFTEFVADESFDNLPVSGKEIRKNDGCKNSISNGMNALKIVYLSNHPNYTYMFNPPRKLETLTEAFQALCDAAIDLNPKPIIGRVPDDLLECAHLLAMVDAAVVRECNKVAELLTTSAPHELLNSVVAHHQKLTDYLYIRSMILDGNQENGPELFDLSVF